MEEDRFLSEIKSDENIDIDEHSAEELAEYAIEEIRKGANMANLFGF